jgi:5-methylcytosine-specific restriction endonuclease McrA
MPRYNWDAVQKYYDAGHTYKECLAYFGFSPDTWTDAVRRGALKAHARSLATPHYLRTASHRGNVKRRLLQEGLLRDECYECGITHWFGEKLSLHLDHINGINDDNQLENLRMLCPNCHSQTETFSGRNVKTLLG